MIGYNSSFNSKLVRLKVPSAWAEKHVMIRFNSKLVRLKGDRERLLFLISGFNSKLVRLKVSRKAINVLYRPLTDRVKLFFADLIFRVDLPSTAGRAISLGG